MPTNVDQPHRPAGKLPFSGTRSAAHAPNYYAQLISHKPDPVNGRYWNEFSAPTYPFGFGLSYTAFYLLQLDGRSVASG